MVANQDEKRQLLGFANFVRNNPKTDRRYGSLRKILAGRPPAGSRRFPCHRFLHMEFYTTDATQAYKRFQHGLGMKLVAKSDQSTGNHTCASYVLQSNEVVLSFTAPYSRQACQLVDSKCPVPHYCAKAATEFVWKHGLAIHSVGVSVDDAHEAYRIATEHGAEGRGPPVVLRDEASGTEQVVAEVKAYGDVVLRFVSGSFQGPYLAGYNTVTDSPDLSYGLHRIDHIVGNVPEIFPVVDYLMKALGWHEFAEFTAADVGTVDSGLNSMVLASNNEFILMPVNEPTFGTRRKSQIQTYLEQNEGSGVQHVALKTPDIFHTLTEMSRRSHCGGFEFVPKPGPEYYAKLPQRIGEDTLTPERFKMCEELGILADRDDQGVLLQIFTKPLGDRPTVFFEIIQRIGCEVTVTDANGHEHVEQAGGCGGFGKGNFSELFKRLEQFETEMGIN